MKHVQASIAKAQFAELLDQVERGDTIAITRHGKTVACLVPSEEARRERSREAVAAIKELRKNGPTATIEEILEWRDEGRK